MLLDIQLSCFLFLFGRWNHHGFVWTVDLEKDSHLLSVSIFPLLAIFEPLILIIGILIINKMIEDVTRVR